MTNATGLAVAPMRCHVLVVATGAPGVKLHTNIAGTGPAVTFNPNEPDGTYELRLSRPSERQVALELLDLAADQGLKTWRNATLNGRRFRLVGHSRQLIPEEGVLVLTFKSVRPVGCVDTALPQVGVGERHSLR